MTHNYKNNRDKKLYFYIQHYVQPAYNTINTYH